MTAPNIASKELLEPNVRLCSATNINMEVEFVAEELQNSVKSGGRFRDSVVLCPDLGVYTPFIVHYVH